MELLAADVVVRAVQDRFNWAKYPSARFVVAPVGLVDVLLLTVVGVVGATNRDPNSSYQLPSWVQSSDPAMSTFSEMTLWSV